MVWTLEIPRVPLRLSAHGTARGRTSSFEMSSRLKAVAGVTGAWEPAVTRRALNSL